jgi:inosine/xanthosine triphosphate pyrophosphatase family protein
VRHASIKIYNDTWNKEKRENVKQIFDAVQHTKALLDDVSLIDEEQTSKSFLNLQIFNFCLHK